VFLTHIKTLLVKACTNTFDDDYPVDQYRNLFTSIKYPEKATEFPSIWIDFDVTSLEPIGVDTIQYEKQDNGTFLPYKTWRFTGNANFVIAAMSSLERDGIFDEMVKVLAFGSLNNGRSVFRNTIDNNDYIRTVFNWDKISPNGIIASPGTPWGSSDILYEATISMGVMGEFSSDTESSALVALSKVIVHPEIDQSPLGDAYQAGY